MENESRRLVSKYFWCDLCKKFENKLVHPDRLRVTCLRCEKYLKEVPEKEYKSYKKQFKPSVDFENSNNYFPQRRSSDQPFKPKNEGYNFRQYSSVYDKPPTNQKRKGGNNNNNDHKSGQRRY